MTCHDNLRSSGLQDAEGREKGANAAVIGDDAVCERDVGVDAKKHDLTGEVRRCGERAESQGLQRFCHERGEVNQTVGVAPLVVIPGAHLDLVTQHPNKSCVDDG